MKPNTMMMRPKPRKSPQTFAELHGEVTPPSCKARSRQTMAPMKNVEPARSSFLIFVIRGMFADCRRGDLKNSRTAAKATPPNGKLIFTCISIDRYERMEGMDVLTQKHHLHVSLSVSAPPSTGPTTDAIPYILDKIPT